VTLLQVLGEPGSLLASQPLQQSSEKVQNWLNPPPIAAHYAPGTPQAQTVCPDGSPDADCETDNRTLAAAVHREQMLEALAGMDNAAAARVVMSGLLFARSGDDSAPTPPPSCVADPQSSARQACQSGTAAAEASSLRRGVCPQQESFTPSRGTEYSQGISSLLSTHALQQRRAQISRAMQRSEGTCRGSGQGGTVIARGAGRHAEAVRPLTEQAPAIPRTAVTLVRRCGVQ
jgi:hypothetical protein